MDQAQLNWITYFIWGIPARLTADLVTGKLDVRAAAAKLPAPPAASAAEPIADEALEEPESEGEGD